jgi:hypothetical protein
VVVASWLPLSGAQIVAVQLLPRFAAAGLQVVTTVGVEATVLHVVDCHELVESAVTLVQEPVGVGPVTVVPGHTVVVQAFPALAVPAVQVEAPIGPTTIVGHVVVV